MVEVQEDMVFLLADAAALADFDGHCTRDYVARGEVFRGRRVALHEALALRIDQIPSLPARSLGDEAAGTVDAGRMELNEFHVLQRQPGTERHRAAIAGLGVGTGAGMIDPAVAAGGENRGLSAEAMQSAVFQAERDDAAAGALVVHDEVDSEEFDVEFR